MNNTSCNYTLEFERAIYNWYLGGDNAPIEPVFNSLILGLENDMQVVVPIEISNSINNSISDPENLKSGDTITLKDDVRIKFRGIGSGDDGKYYIPAFTNHDEMNKGELSSSINQPLKDLIDNYNKDTDCKGVVVNPWDKRLLLVEPSINAMLGYKRRSHISIVKGSVLDLHVSAIVNSSNMDLNRANGVSAAIQKAAGEELLKKCESLNGCKPGEAKITGSYNISKADYIIHTVGPSKPGDEEILAKCYTSSLELAVQSGCCSIAFPSISTGKSNYPLNEATQISYISTLKWISEHPDVVINVYFACYRDEEYETYQQLISKLMELSKS